jgi:excisionase family DNA binding protein
MDERAVERTPDTGQDIDGAGTLSATKAAELLGVNERTIRRAIVRGEILATKLSGVYRIAPADLRRYQNRRRFHVRPAPRRTVIDRSCCRSLRATTRPRPRFPTRARP